MVAAQPGSIDCDVELHLHLYPNLLPTGWPRPEETRRRQLGAAYWVYAAVDAYMTRQLGGWLLASVGDVAERYTLSTGDLLLFPERRCHACSFTDNGVHAGTKVILGAGPGMGMCPAQTMYVTS